MNRVRTGEIEGCRGLPALVEALPGTDPDLAGWLADNEGWVRETLLRHGAVLFRGFGIDSPEALAAVVRSTSGPSLSYVDGNSPRRKLAGGVYTSTEYPADQRISPHNELSYSHQWPARLFFACSQPAEEGGETSITDGRRVLAALSPEVVQAFRDKGVRYVRNLHGGRGPGPSWQYTFETAERSRVEEILSEDPGVEHEWLRDGLRIVQKRPGLIRHPETGEEVWFNQADQFHPTNLPEEVREAMLALFGGREEDLPIHATFGDGTPIPAETLDEVRRTTTGEASLFPWRAGDLLVVDNVLVLHGRMPFRGPRRILVAMT